MSPDVSNKIKQLLVAKFGPGIQNSLIQFDDDEDPREIMELAHTMLVRLLGKKLAVELLKGALGDDFDQIGHGKDEF